MSSFDSNHLFNAFSFIASECKKARQLFVLTHNFWFFKQVRDWMHRQNNKNITQSHVYVIRRGTIVNAEKSLTKYHSEYHYVFSNILEYVSSGNLSLGDDFSVANTARRVLEAFSSFKTPHDHGISGALELGVKNGLETSKKERIYFFLNKYSHLDRIESFENTIENISEEGRSVVLDILELIKRVDVDHYHSMLQICNSVDILRN